MGLYTVLKPCLKCENINITKNDVFVELNGNIIKKWY